MLCIVGIMLRHLIYISLKLILSRLGFRFCQCGSNVALILGLEQPISQVAIFFTSQLNAQDVTSLHSGWLDCDMRLPLTHRPPVTIWCHGVLLYSDTVQYLAKDSGDPFLPYPTPQIPAIPEAPNMNSVSSARQDASV